MQERSDNTAFLSRCSASRNIQKKSYIQTKNPKIMEQGLRTIFKWMMGVFAFIVCVTACQDDYRAEKVVEQSIDSTENPKVPGYVYETELKHYIDTARKVVVEDQMISGLKIWRTADGVKVEKILDNQADPRVDAYSRLAREDYNISADQLDILPLTERIARKDEVRDSDGVTRYELDTVYYDFPDAQVKSIPIKITNKTVTVANYVYFYSSLTFDHAEFVHLRNTLISTRATQIRSTYRTEYKTNLYFKETNVVNPKMIVLPIYAYTTRYIVSDDEVVKVYAENKTRTLLDTLTERCAFDRVTVYKSGDVVRDNISTILYHKVSGIDPYSKDVSNFEHRLRSVNDVFNGTEVQNRTDGNWTMWQRVDSYSANIENGVAADKVVTDYSLMHERTVYKDDSLTVDFGYEDFAVAENGTTVTPRISDRPSYDEALLDNHIVATYIGRPHNASEIVWLYKLTKAVTKYEFENPSLIVYRDSVVGNIDFVRTFNDGTVERIHDHINQPKSLVCNTNWESVQRVATQVTDDKVQVNLVSAENASEGYWRFQRQNRTLSAYATLYDGNAKLNSWTSIVPNTFVYTREGQTYAFKEIDFAVVQNGASLNLRGENGGFTLYDYKDNIAVTYGTDVQASTAPGLVKINGQEVVGYDIRNKKLTINPENIVATLDFVTKFANGTESKEPISKEFPRSLTPTTNWKAYENSAQETTLDPQISSMQKQTRQEGEWYWDEETRTIAANVQLASSSQFNGWTSVDPNNIRFTREGVMADFGALNFSVIKVASNTSLVSSEALQDTYAYNNAISVSYGSSAYNTNTKSSSDPGTIYVQKEKQVTGHEFRNPQLVISDDNVTASLTYVTLFNDGTETTEAVSKVFSRGLTPYTNWTSTEKNNTAVTSVASIILSMTNQVVDGNWAYSNETRDITTTVTLSSSTQKNGWTSIDPNSIKYTRDGKTYEFGNISFNATEAGQNVALVESEALQDKYSYSDKINVLFGSNTKSSTAPGAILVQKAKQVTGYEFRNPELVVSNDYVTASLTFVTLYNDGTEDKDPVSKQFARSLEPYTDWTSTEQNSNEQTSSATVSLVSSNPQNDGEWSYVNNTHRINTTATLAGSTQTNGWNAVEPNDIVFTRNGQQYKFNKLTFNASESGHGTTLASSTALLDIHNYVDQITVTYGGNSKSSSAPGKINVKKDKQVTDHEFRNPQLVISDNSVKASLTYVTKYNDGTEDTEAVSKDFPRSLTPYTNWASTEQNSNESTGSASVNLKSSSAQNDGNWSYVKETRDITTIATLNATKQTNGWTAEDPNTIKYTRDGKTYEFGTVNFSATEAGHSAKLKNETSTLATYDYVDKINVTFGDNTKSSTAPGTINVEKEIVITGYEISNQRIVVEQGNVTASLTYTTIYSDGTKKDENLSKVLPRSFRVLTNWASTEANANESTGAATVTLTNSANKTDGDWSYVSETRNINTIAKLNGSSQDNKWESVDPNSIVFSRNGKSYDFGTLTYNATETGSDVKQKSSNNNETVYSYTDNISVTYGSNSFNSSAPGTIKVAQPWNPDFPASYGKFKSVAVTATQNEDRNTWVYAVSVHFDNGTLPLIIRQNASAPDPINNDSFTTSTDSRLNSAYYVKSRGTWINAIASDESKHMAWKDVNGETAGILVYSTATVWGWDDGHRSGGHPTVFTEKYSAKLSNNNTVLTIYDSNGKVFATYKSAR
ncbi:MAG: hypothetical protein IJ218_07205 [Alphaproteobacteria bacterium]|nr:hypothetical protein [Alphaproteobacteria bacterium]